MAKSTQLFLRIEPREKRLIERGAKLDRRSMSDFIRLCAMDRATELIEAEKIGRR